MGCLMELVGPRGSIDMGINQHATVAEAWSTRRSRRHRVSILNDIEAALQRQHRDLDSEDVIKWKGKSGKFKPSFSTKDTWNHIRTTTAKVRWHKGVWFTHATPKYTFCTWLAMHNRLSTGDRMSSWNAGANTTCVLCSNVLETRDHLFFSCTFSAEIWFTLTHQLFEANYSTDWQAIVNYIMDKSLPRIQGLLARYVFQASIHTIWRERNARRHGEASTQPASIIKFIDKQVRNKLVSIRSVGDRRYDESLQTWFATS